MYQIQKKISGYSASTIIIGINIIAYLLQVLIPRFTSIFVLDSSRLIFEPWRLITSMFLHSTSDPWHLVFNMMWIFFIGSMLEQRIGTKRFLTIYLTSGLIAGLGASLFYPRALGASGAIMGIVGTTIILIPRQIIYLNFIPVPLWLAGLIFAFVDLIGIFIPNNVGNIAHLLGLFAGIGYGFYLKGKKSKTMKRFRSKTHIDEKDMEDYMLSGKI